jgi:hypothetical protein
MPFCPGGVAIIFLRCIVLENIDAQDTQDMQDALWGGWNRSFFLMRAVDEHCVGVLTRYSVCFEYIVYIPGADCQN